MFDIYRMFVVPEGKSGERGAKMMVNLGVAMAGEAIKILELEPKDNVIEIGFGPGIGLQTLAKIVSQGTVAGIDPSELMHRLAGKRNMEAINSGQINLFEGTVEHLPFENNYFNGALAMDNMHFWTDPLKGLKELQRVLLPGAKLVCSFTPSSAGSKRGWEEVFIKAGYVDFTIKENPMGFCIIGTVFK